MATAAGNDEMPHRTTRTYYESLGIVREQFNRGNDEPCQQCRQPFRDYDSGFRLKTTAGQGVRGYRRVCYGCCMEKLDSLTTFHYQTVTGQAAEREANQDGDGSK